MLSSPQSRGARVHPLLGSALCTYVHASRRGLHPVWGPGLSVPWFTFLFWEADSDSTPWGGILGCPGSGPRLRPPRLAGALIHERLSPFRQRTVERRGVSGDLGVGLWPRVRLGATVIHTQVGGCFRWR